MNKSDRRHIWPTNNSASSPSGEALQEFGSALPAAPAVPVVEQLRVAERTRNRVWEEKHQAHAFRGVAPNVHAAVRAIAENEQCTVDEIAQALLDFGLLCCQRGEIDIQPVLSNQRRTLFPDTDSQGKKPKLQWTEKTWGLKPPKKRPPRPKKRGELRPWKDWPVVAYRLEKATFQAIAQVCQRKRARYGEVISKLLMHALDTYETGRLVLSTETGEETL